MKKIVLACILLSGAYQLKAQQLQVKPADSLANAIKRSIKLQTDSWKLLTPTLKGNETLALNTSKLNYTDLKTNYFHENMPVAVLEGNSKMPVVKLDGYDNMPVKWISHVDQGIFQQKTLQGSPAFKSPVILSPVPQK
ncbi:hypothetical protein [Mucilaginibacter sp. OK098]|uniref:hypothetical protein n=1 Tax=Mucilaginibacter sp. OK098 TaxID=1855297 RepID=UPI00091A867B|nr:hypothetical protein [Mucilaginibacter sp. OK098]SHN20769.1 hypothetical protein SAMN05216524_106418 [Mucilaginibacter sp. OK098]